MPLIRLRRAAQLTLPLEIRRAARLKEGDYLEAEVTQAGILLRPVNVDRREPTVEEEADILEVVNRERKAYAEERRR
jgi:AbrB family looped-hinge helix DNA binding protein